MDKFYITTAIPYVNAKPHIGHALEFVQSDTITRYHKILGDEVLLLCGGDENAIKNVQAAGKEGIPTQKFIDKNSNLFLELSKKLNVQFDIWQKGSDPKHHLSSQRLWELCDKAGDIYKKRYEGLYCIGCELFYTKEELDEKGECFEHPGKKLEEVSEENWFFNLKKYENDLKRIINDEKDPQHIEIVPEKRRHEIQSFLTLGLKDISISRSNNRAKNWGVQIPNDPNQRMYVWFDALNIYQSGIGFGSDEKKYNKWWPADLHVIGKGILRFHAIYWPAFLLSAGLKLPKKIFVHEYVTVGGQKMSKTIGNVLDPLPLIDKYGTDALRYYLLAKISPFADGDFSEEKFKETYNADLANGLGNLVARLAGLAKNLELETKINNSEFEIGRKVQKYIENYQFNLALEEIWDQIKKINVRINLIEVWKLSDQDRKIAIESFIKPINHIATNLKPFLPETAQKIENQFKGPKIKSEKPLFPRI